MKLNKIFVLLSVLIVFSLSLAAVSATDISGLNNDNDSVVLAATSSNAKVGTSIEIIPHSENYTYACDNYIDARLVDDDRNPLANKNVNFLVDSQYGYINATYKTGADGLIRAYLSTNTSVLDAHSYTGLFTFIGDSNYTASNASVDFTIEPAKTLPEFEIKELSKNNYIVEGWITFPDDPYAMPLDKGHVRLVVVDKNGRVVFKSDYINLEDYEEGNYKIPFTVDGLNGPYNVSVYYTNLYEAELPFTNYANSTSYKILNVSNDNNGDNIDKDSSKVSTLPNTGNPLLVLLLSLISIPLIRIKK